MPPFFCFRAYLCSYRTQLMRKLFGAIFIVLIAITACSEKKVQEAVVEEIPEPVLVYGLSVDSFYVICSEDHFKIGKITSKNDRYPDNDDFSIAYRFDFPKNFDIRNLYKFKTKGSKE